MADNNLTRRQFLRSTTRIGLTLALASALTPPARPVQADEGSFISILGGLDILRIPEVQEWMGTGVGALWVAGKYLNTFASNLDFNNLPAILKEKYQFAGGEFKGLPAAEAIWKTIPLQIRAGKPEDLWKFHVGKDWSHIIPKSWGGPTTAENGIWWSSEKNKSLGANPMSPEDIADAKAVLRSEAVKATIVQTISGMVKGSMIGIVVGGILACLECGLERAEGKISWAEMGRKVVKASVIAGTGAVITTGIIVGVALLFPILIPIMTPVLFVLQIVTFAFLGQHLFSLAKAWWEALEVQDLLDASVTVLKDVGSRLRRMVKSAQKSVTSVFWDWVNMIAYRSGIYWAWSMAMSVVQQMGIDRALSWFALQTQAVTGQTAALVSSLDRWGYTPYVVGNVNAIMVSISSVVTTQFQYAISTTDVLLRSITESRKNASLQFHRPLLVA